MNTRVNATALDLLNSGGNGQALVRYGWGPGRLSICFLIYRYTEESALAYWNVEVPPLRPDGTKLDCWDAEHSLNALRVPDRNLDVSLFVEARSLIDRAAFDEDAFHRVDRLIAPVAADTVDHLNHRAIQSPQ